MAKETAEQELTRLREEVAQHKKNDKLTFKVSEKTGALSAYFPRQRFPTTLYADQWKQLLDNADLLKDFMEANKSKLKVRE
jgi:uncharacterized circularly permuted ATP-grasp superfamily protein